MHPGSPLLVGIDSHTPSKRLYVGASLGGDLVQTPPIDPPLVWPAGAALIELRFRGATGGVPMSNAGEVVEFRWIGGEISPGGVLNYSTMPGAFADLGFLHVP